jgi:predicted type IV restriction endonuclease
MNKEEGKIIVEQKVNEFQEHEDIFKKKGHGETNIRSNFIDHFFKALGWEMDKFTDVDREYSQKDNSGTKKVD